jgi:hypothetical protein
VSGAERNPLLAAALAYASRGWYVVPLHHPVRANNGWRCSCGELTCQSPAKHPRTKNGHLDATTHESTIRAWWKLWPRANVGTACGPSGLIVPDIDPRHGGDASFEALRARLGASTFETLTHQTGGGGAHYIFHAPPEVVEKIGSHTNALGPEFPGIDVKAAGGYIVAPPSQHIFGAQYTKELSSPDDPAELPQQLASLLIGFAQQKPSTGAITSERIPEGTRHDRLFRAACALRRQGANAQTIGEALRGMNAQCDPPLDKRELLNLARDVAARYAPEGAPSKRVNTTSSDGHGPEFVRASEMLDDADEAIEYVVEGMIPVGGTAVFAGRPKSGKTTTALDLALCVARGAPWLGRSTHGGPVLYVALEGAEGYWRAKLRGLGVRQGDELYVCVGRAPDAAIAWLRSAIERHGAALVIVDTMQRLLRVKDGNDYATGSNATDAVIELARMTGAALLMVHHSGKRSRDAIVDEVMGSTAWAAAVDTVIVLRRHGEQRTIVSEQRCGAPIDETVLALDELGHVLAAGSKTESDTQAMREAIVAFLREQPEPVDEPGIDAGVEGRTFIKRRVLRMLVGESVVGRTGTGRKGNAYLYALPTLGGPEPAPADSRSVVPDMSGEQENEDRIGAEKVDEIRAHSRSLDCKEFPEDGTRNGSAGDELFDYAAEHPGVGLAGPRIESDLFAGAPMQEKLDF